MSDNKKYYYLKLKENFFDTDEMIILESMPDGHLYSNILLKLYLRSLKNEGRLMFNDRIPYNSTMLAQITRHSVGTVEKALHVFKELSLIDILDTGAIYMLDIQNYIGKSTTEADRKRLYRQKIDGEKLLLTGQEGGQMSGQKSDKSPPEIELELELELETERESMADKPPAPSDDSEEPGEKPKKTKAVKHLYGEYKHVKLTDEEYMKLQRDFQNAKELITHLDEHIEMKNYKANSHYLAIRKWVVDAVEETKLRKQRNRGGSGYDGRAGTDRQDTDKSHSFGTYI